MGIIILMLLGGLAGFAVSNLKGTDSGHKTTGDILLGILGAIVGGISVSFAGLSGINGFNIFSLIVAIIGSVTLIGMGRILYNGH